MSGRPRPLAAAFGWIGAGFGLSRAVAALTNILAGRLMAPEDFGDVNLAVNAGSLISVLMLCGMHVAVIRYGAAASAPGERDGYVATGAGLVGALTLVVGLAGFGLAPFWAPACGLGVALARFACAYAVVATGWQMVAGLQQVHGRFRRLGVLEFLRALLVIPLFLGLRPLLGGDYRALLLGYLIAYALTAGGAFLPEAGALRAARFSREKLRAMTPFGLYNLGCNINFFLLAQVQYLLLNALMTPRAVGVYAAYALGSVALASYAGSAIGTVLFPEAARADRAALWRRVEEAWLRYGLAVLVAFAAGVAAVILLMGRSRYGLDGRLVFLFATAAMLIVLQNILSQVIGAEGRRGARRLFGIGVVVGGFNLLASALLIPGAGVAGAALALILAYGLNIACLWRARAACLENPSR